jgi:peptidyl-prolyl cis-trans isomerase D
MVKEKMLDALSDDIGVAISQEELNDLVYGENISPILMQLPLFTDPQTRQFSKEAMSQFLTFISADIKTLPVEQQQQHLMFTSMWVVIQRMIKYQRLEEKYNALVTSAVAANNTEAKANIEDTKSNANIAYVISRYSLLPDSAFSVSNDEIKKLYNERKNSYKQASNLAKISYFAKDVRPSEADYEAIQTEMQQVREKLVDAANPALLVADYSEIPYQDVFVSESSLTGSAKQFAASAATGDVYGPERDNDAYRLYKLIGKTTAPDSVNLRLISIPLSDEAVANRVADSLLNVIKTEKEFAIVATELNPQSNGGEVGWVTEAALAAGGDELIKSCFGGKKGDVLKLKLNGVINLIKIEDITKPVSKVKLATIQMSVPVSDKTLLDIDTELNQFVAGISGDTDFNKAANEKGYNLFADQTVTPSEISLNQIKGSRQVISWAFNEKIGSVKKFDLPDQRVIAKIVEQTEAGFQPIADVAPILKAELVKAKKAEKIIADLKTKNLTTLDAYAQELSARVDTVRFVNFATASLAGLGREPVLTLASKYGEANKLQGPAQGNSGVLVYAVLNRTESAANQDVAMAKSIMDRSYMYRINPMILMEALKEKMGVEDNRVKFY